MCHGQDMFLNKKGLVIGHEYMFNWIYTHQADSQYEMDDHIDDHNPFSDHGTSVIIQYGDVSPTQTAGSTEKNDQPQACLRTRASFVSISIGESVSKLSTTRTTDIDMT